MIWKFAKSYKGMFWYSIDTRRYPNEEDREIIVVCIYGDIYRNAMHPTYTYNDFFSAFICDDDVIIDEVAIL